MQAGEKIRKRIPSQCHFGCVWIFACVRGAGVLQQIFEKQTGSRRELRINFTFFETQRLKRSRECATGANCESDKLECLFQTDKPKTHTLTTTEHTKNAYTVPQMLSMDSHSFLTHVHTAIFVSRRRRPRKYTMQIFETDKKIIFTTRARTQ